MAFSENLLGLSSVGRPLRHGDGHMSKCRLPTRLERLRAVRAHVNPCAEYRCDPLQNARTLPVWVEMGLPLFL